jgi:hypothetical protein
MAFTLLTLSPPNGAVNVPLNTEIQLSITNNINGIDFNTITVQIDDEMAFTGLSGFNRPAFDGEIFYINNHLVLKIQPRRLFIEEKFVAIKINLNDQNIPPLETYSLETSFVTKKLPIESLSTRSLPPALRRFLTPFISFSHLDVYRQVLGEYLTNNPKTITLCIGYRLQESILKALLPTLFIPPILQVPADILPILPLVDKIKNYSYHWELALEDLARLSIGPKTRDYIDRAMQDTYPQNQVGAVCAAVLIGADKMAFVGM